MGSSHLREIRRAYGFDEVSIVPGDITINPDQTSIDFSIDGLSFATPVRYLLPCFDAHAVKTLEGWLGVEMRVFEPGDEQRCAC